MKVLTIAHVGLVRLLRDRGTLFSFLVLPLLLVALVGRGGDRDAPRVAIAGPLAEQVAERLNAAGGIDAEAVRDPVEDALAGRIALGVVIGADAERRAAAGERVPVKTYGRDDDARAALAPLVAGALSDELLGADSAPDVVLRNAAGASGGSLGAARQVALFVFLTSLLSASTMVQNRKLGVTWRMLATPTPAATIVAGEAAARWAVALAQALYIVVATALLFGVDWGSLPMVALVLLTFTAVGAGAGMLLGALVDDEMVVVGLALMVGLTVGALSGAMVPRELFTPALSDVAGLLPHAWAIEGLDAARAGESAFGQALALGALAAVLLALASWRLLARIR